MQLELRLLLHYRLLTHHLLQVSEHFGLKHFTQGVRMLFRTFLLTFSFLFFLAKLPLQLLRFGFLMIKLSHQLISRVATVRCDKA